MVGQPGVFDLSDRYAALSAAGDPLERLASVVDFEVFRGPLIATLRRSGRGKGGRPPFAPVMRAGQSNARRRRSRNALIPERSNRRPCSGPNRDDLPPAGSLDLM